MIQNKQIIQISKLPGQESNLRRLDSESSFRTNTEPPAIKFNKKTLLSISEQGSETFICFSSAQTPEPNLWFGQEGNVSSLPLMAIVRTAGLAQTISGWVCCPLCQLPILVIETNIIIPVRLQAVVNFFKSWLQLSESLGDSCGYYKTRISCPNQLHPL